MNALNRDDVQEALYESGRNWNIDAIIDEAEYHAMINGEFDEDFTYEDRDTEYRFECLKPTTYIYDEEGELVQGMGDEEYWLEWIQDKKTGRDIYRKYSPQYEEMFKDTRKASENKAQGVKADEKKEVFVYKAMDVNGNGVFKVFYDDGTYEILRGGRAYERSLGDYDKFVSMETLRHATAPPKGTARKASARGVKADSQKHKMRLYNDLTVEQLEKEKARQEKYLKYYLAQPDRWKVEGYIKQCYKIINACNMAIKALNDADTEDVEGSALRKRAYKKTLNRKCASSYNLYNGDDPKKVLKRYVPDKYTAEQFDVVRNAGKMDEFAEYLDWKHPLGVTDKDIDFALETLWDEVCEYLDLPYEV